MIASLQQRNLPSIAGSRSEFLLKHQFGEMFRDNVWNTIPLTDLHRSIARPLGTMGMKDVGLPVF